MTIFNRLLLIFLGTMMALLVIEFGLRQLGPAVDPAAKNEWLGWVGWAGHPHQVVTYITDQFTTTEVINSAGLPDVEHSYHKPSDVYRILIIGDSFVEAYQVNLEQSFPRLLEKMLNDRRSPEAPRFEVIKAGYRSWGTDQEWLYFQGEGYKYQPDLVLLGFTVNDVVDNYTPLKAKMVGWPENAPPKPFYTLENGELKRHNFPFPPPPAEVQPQTWSEYLYKYSVAYRLAGQGWEAFQLKIAELNQPSNPLDNTTQTSESRFPRHTMHFSMPVYQESALPEYEQAWQLTLALLKTVADEVTQQQIAFAVFSNSQIWSTHPSVREALVFSDPLYANTQFDWDRPDKRIGQLWTEMDIPFLPLDPGFRAYASQHRDQLLFFNEGHWNEAGHQLAAQLLYDWLVAQKLVPH
jgi:lysophospholipase L1-like esterase